ncbi:MAG: hypothetical protein H6719_24005 [Sandaracinaceae bacterium]|nr:hypothetical protein [Sandaracinaceae bacterium]
MPRAWIALGLALWIGGCGGADPDELVGITRGVYGRTQRFDAETGEVSDIELDVSSMHEDDGAVRATTSGPHGFYEIGLEPGAYRVCTGSGTCSDVLHVVDEAWRCDFTAQATGGGSWRCSDR